MREIKIWRGIRTGAIPDGDGRISRQFVAAQMEQLPPGWLPLTACTTIRMFVAGWEDALDDTMFDRLKPYARRMLGTRGPIELERRRGWLALDWLIRTNTVAWLRLAKRTHHADALASLPPQTSVDALAASAAVRHAAHVPKADVVKTAEGPRPSAEDPAARLALVVRWAVCRLRRRRGASRDRGGMERGEPECGVW